MPRWPRIEMGGIGMPRRLLASLLQAASFFFKLSFGLFELKCARSARYVTSDGELSSEAQPRRHCGGTARKLLLGAGCSRRPSRRPRAGRRSKSGWRGSQDSVMWRV
jgi:hypothetical protein